MVLAKPPKGPRARELWIQHAAGMVLFERVRGAGLAYLNRSLPAKYRRNAEAAIDYALYALMMLIDGVSDGIRGGGRSVQLDFGVRLMRGKKLELQLDLRNGDGMCMGFHGWKEGDYGEHPILQRGGKLRRKSPRGRHDSRKP